SILVVRREQHRVLHGDEPSAAWGRERDAEERLAHALDHRGIPERALVEHVDGLDDASHLLVADDGEPEDDLTAWVGQALDGVDVALARGAEELAAHVLLDVPGVHRPGVSGGIRRRCPWEDIRPARVGRRGGWRLPPERSPDQLAHRVALRTVE